MYLKYAKFKIIIKGIKVAAAAYLRNQYNFWNQKNSNVRRRLAKVTSIASKKHDCYQCLSRSSLQVRYSIFTNCFIQCFKLIATHTKKQKPQQPKSKIHLIKHYKEKPNKLSYFHELLFPMRLGDTYYNTQKTKTSTTEVINPSDQTLQRKGFFFKKKLTF
jgi:hypothetical protein